MWACSFSFCSIYQDFEESVGSVYWNSRCAVHLKWVKTTARRIPQEDHFLDPVQLSCKELWEPSTGSAVLFILILCLQLVAFRPLWPFHSSESRLLF